MIVDTMKVFVTVIEQKNFTRAAEILNISQPNVSLHIRNLENDLGTKLVHRSPKQVRITEAGEILYKHAKQILLHFEEAKHEINDLRHVVTGKLRVGASFTIGEYILPKVLAEYAGQFPLVDVQIIISNTEEVIEGVRSNQLDIGLIEGETNCHDIHIQSFMEDEMIVVVPSNHTLSQMRLIEKDMLQNQIWISREVGSGTRTYMDKFISELGLIIKRSFVFSSNQGVKEAVKAGLGIALLSRWTIDREIETNEIRALTLKNKKIKRPFSFVKSKNSDESKAIKMFLQKIEEFRMNN
ncbi:LysR family transcriptional regulator [Neobacillus ginsengisoli]|uniref:DNA-binding transcriptional LysR family regulator n=1 Tax=Neobacillus ginsengisoli TaxID=904295 RepID=A0ABT9XWL6_9BACI|nr:LysR family transcriptional regulator [Neobacillus ginsengisoli]MDQ0199970.1 DNA-binding transcriptional LysR family regulator [Neobacillus ginsengisoli]